MKLLKSKKFWMAVGGLGAVAISTYLGIDEATINKVVAIVVSAILGQGLADFGKENK